LIKEIDLGEKFNKFSIHVISISNPQTVLERRSNKLKERREAIEMTKAGKMSQEELDTWKPKAKKLTLNEKKKEKYNKRVSEAVKFAKSKKNRNRNKGATKK